MSNRLVKKDGKEKSSASDILLEVIRYIAAITMILIGIIIPLYLKDGYHGVGDCKYEAYEWCVRIGFISLILVLAVYWVISSKKNEDFRMTYVDCFAAVFAVFSVVSALAGGNFMECLRGYKGWYMGVTSVISFVLLYYFASNYAKFYRVIIFVFCTVAFVTFVLAVLNRLLIDPLGVYEGIADKFKNQFLSTLGQATWYSSYMAVLLPIGAGYFISSKREEKPIVFFLSMLFCTVGFMSAVSQNSDSIYFALTGMFLALLFVCKNSAEGISRYFELVLLFFVSTRLMYLLLIIHPNEILKLDKLSTFMIYNPVMWALTVLVGIVCEGIYYFNVKKERYSEKFWKIFFYVIFGIFALAVILSVIILIADAKGVLPESISNVTSKLPYLHWSEKWGTDRGWTWTFSAMMYGEMSLKNKLFGVGPDGYAPYAYSFYHDRLYEMWGDRTLTNAHNEWMNALISYGLVGAVAYIGIFVSAFGIFVKKTASRPELMGFAASIAAYMFHNFFCYQQVCCTPFLFMLIGMGIYIYREDVKDTAAGE
ncbi:MAG TPA: hypothetical protein DCG85_06045 [Lachnospiraceae bacterium]|nr:hypothetical protein [Lachnospiraceae bacterium]